MIFLEICNAAVVLAVTPFHTPKSISAVHSAYKPEPRLLDIPGFTFQQMTSALTLPVKDVMSPWTDGCANALRCPAQIYVVRFTCCTVVRVSDMCETML